ncbi:metallophosphoesterase family protein [Stappia sp. F7233]|uniref:Metallophosphoesterase family protein n=1 Tax=Stappia albiluteola TaxID=2758565 RepID=A0A839AGK7_9HYPH|nr:metallophosphoesterase family protein [Stappia albiluteola]MBA5777679.1 metallophosphoesterase family protein [Stappia albiluteola]
MKIAVIADIHGNLPALEAVLDDLKAEAPDAIVNLGDCVSGPLWPQETAERLMAENWLTIRGNHDRQLFDRPREKLGASDAFAAERLDARASKWLQDLPATALFDDVFLCHGTPRRDDVYLTEKVEGPKGHLASEPEILAGLDGEAAPLLLCGHTHIPRLIRLSTGQTVLNPGSVGLPSYDDDHPNRHAMEAGSPHARYAIFRRRGQQFDFTFRAIEYDWDLAARRAAQGGRPDWARSLKYGFFGPLS